MKSRPAPPHIHSGFRLFSWEHGKIISLLPFWAAAAFNEPMAAIKIFPLIILTVYFLEWLENRLTAKAGRLDQYLVSVFGVILLGLFLPKEVSGIEVIAAAFFYRMLIVIYGGYGFHLFHPVLGAYVLIRMFHFQNGEAPFWISAGPFSWPQVAGVLLGILIYFAANRRYREMPWIFAAPYVFSSVFWGVPPEGSTGAVSILFLFAIIILGDPVTTPTTRTGYRIFSLCAGFFSSAAERWGGMDPVFSLAPVFIFLNTTVPWLDEWFRPKSIIFRETPA